MIRTPVCGTCLASGSLCQGCLERKERGEISEAELRLSRALYRQGSAAAENAGFEKALEMGETVLVFTKTPASLIGKGGRIVSALGREVGKKLKIIDVEADAVKQIREILLPAKLSGINKVFRKEGAEYRIRVPRNDAARLPADAASLQKIFSELLKGDAKILFE